MKITLLGTGSPIPDPNRSGPASLVQSGDAHLLIDAGRGVVTRLVGAGLFPFMLSGVLITHLHSDHIGDLNDIITTTWVMAGDDMDLKIYGPAGTKALVAAALTMLELDISYRVTHHDSMTHGPSVSVIEISAGDSFEIAGLSVEAAATDHRPVAPTLAYKISDATHSVVMAGDGIPCDSLDEPLAGASAYVQSVIRDDLVRAIPVPRMQDILDYHSTALQAGETAAKAGIETLILTHYVPAPAPGNEHEFTEIAAQAFSGRIEAGPDLTVIDL